MHAITVKDENSGEERTVYVHQDAVTIAQAAKQQSLARTFKQQAYIVRHQDWGLFLCIQEGAGSRYHPINTKEHQLNIDRPDTKVMTDTFRYTGKPIKR